MKAKDATDFIIISKISNFSLAGSARGQCVTNLRDNRYTIGYRSIRYMVANFSLSCSLAPEAHAFPSGEGGKNL